MKEKSLKIRNNEIKQWINDTDESFDNPNDVILSWKDAFTFKIEDTENGENGLRNPQIGGIYAVLAHWSCSNEVGTIVMPTGTGKTETMLSLLVKEQITKLLIIVPTDPLRRQIADKFLKLGLLETLGIVKNVKFPVVGLIKTKFDTDEEITDFFERCNVIVATATILDTFATEKIEIINKFCTHLFIDEAHHSSARTWFELKNTFANKPIIQFTATPYRNDEKKIGKIIYNYPLKKAQAEGYFKSINFVKVYEYTKIKSDKLIADKAVQQLREDKKLYPHILLARVSTTKRAEEVYKIYQDYSDLVVVRIHSNLLSSEKKAIHNQILSKKVDVIVCVDMLGEGFDLPELKIAAFHDIRKSLPITLQFIGRFTRTKYDQELGNATIIANLGSVEVTDELDELYSRDIDWNLLLPNISERKTQNEIDYYNFIQGFSDSENLKIPLNNLKPAQSTVIYKNHTKGWFPKNFEKGFSDIKSYDVIRHGINQQEKLLVIVTAKKNFVKWTDSKEVFDFSWDLYIVYWESKHNLLFIHSSDTTSLHKDLANAILDDSAEIINGDNGGAIFRVFSGVQRFKLQNVGLIEVLGKLIRFVMRVGSDIEPALSQAQINKAKKAMIFGAGFEHGNSVSIGCSYKGRIWSRKTTDLRNFIKWCKEVADKVTNNSIDAEAVLKGTLTSKTILSRPEIYPICIDWNKDVYQQSETKFSFEIEDGKIFEYVDTELRIVNPSEKGALKIGLFSNDNAIVELELQFFKNNQQYDDFRFIKLNPNKKVFICYGTKRKLLEEYFYDYAPVIWFANGNYLDGNSYIELKSVIKAYDSNKIEVWDWTGVDLSIEAQGVSPKITNSIQYKCLTELKQKDYDIIYDDDGSGEIADIVTIKMQEDKIEVELYHLKYASEGKVSTQIKNLYEVCGQAQKSTIWRAKSNKEFVEHLLRREIKTKNSQTCLRYEKGTKEDLITVIDYVHNKVEIVFKIFIVQPGLSKSENTVQQLTLLGVTENYLLETAMIQLQVIGSK